QDALGREPDDVERADQVDVDDPGEVLEWEDALLADDPAGGADAGAVHGHAQWAEPAGDVEGGADLLGVGDVGRGEGAADRLGLLGAGRGGEIDDDDLRPRLRQPRRRGQAEPGGAAGDDGRTALDLRPTR